MIATRHPFQSTHPHGVRLFLLCKCFDEIFRFQSTHPHGVRHIILSIYCQYFFISIHAPAWGATGCVLGKPPIKAISIHAPAWGATIMFHYLTNFIYDFNPRTRMGCDLCAFYIKSSEGNFNPRTRMGCDNVNPRWFNQPPPISIHAPAWGATSQSDDLRGGRSISIHAPAWGATKHRTAHCCARFISIHAPAWGATNLNAAMGEGYNISIHAPAWGATFFTSQSVPAF